MTRITEDLLEHLDDVTVLSRRVDDVREHLPVNAKQHGDGLADLQGVRFHQPVGRGKKSFSAIACPRTCSLLIVLYIEKIMVKFPMFGRLWEGRGAEDRHEEV